MGKSDGVAERGIACGGGMRGDLLKAKVINEKVKVITFLVDYLSTLDWTASRVAKALFDYPLFLG